MTVARLISPAFRSGLLMAAGTALIALPTAFGLGAAAIVTGVAVGAAIVALALAGTEANGRGTLPVTAQSVYDRGIALGLLMVGAVFAVAGDGGAALLFGAAGVGALIVTAITRYSAGAV
jgi:hypothetical protein